jgi:hypothetical protein
MFVVGQKANSTRRCVMSDLPPAADMPVTGRFARSGPSIDCGPREGNDNVVVRLGTAHHDLSFRELNPRQ